MNKKEAKVILPLSLNRRKKTEEGTNGNIITANDECFKLWISSIYHYMWDLDCVWYSWSLKSCSWILIFIGSYIGYSLIMRHEFRFGLLY